MMLSILKKLINIDTQFKKDTLEAVFYIKEYLEAFNCEVELFFNDAKTRASLVASIGNTDKTGVIFSGHLDTVAIDADFYKNAGLDCLEEDGKVYGRGACDMKGSIATFLSIVPNIIDQGKTAYLVLTHDEEGGFKGIEQICNSSIINKLKQQKLCVVMEPTLLKAVIGHKGSRAISVEVIGKSGHSALPSECIDATDDACRLYAKIVDEFRALADKYGKNECFAEELSTISCGMFNSGQAHNMVSGYAKFSLVTRENPNCDFDALFSDITKNINIMSDIKESCFLNVPAFDSSYKNIGELGLPQEYVSYGSEAGFFEKNGIPTIICGAGSIEQAHSKNEYIEISQMIEYKELLLKFF